MIYQPERMKDGKRYKSPYWYVKLSIHGHTVHGSTGTTKRKLALNIEAFHRERLNREAGLAPKKSSAIQPQKLATFLREEFVPYAEQRFGPRSKTTLYYGYGATLLSHFMGWKTLNEISDRDAREFETACRNGKLRTRNEGTMQASTVNCALRTLRRCLSYAEELGRIPRRPKVRMAKGENERTRALSEQESNTYLAACPEPWRTAAQVILSTGARPEEVRRLRWEQIEWKDGGGIIYVQRGKTQSAKRPLPLLPALYEVLRQRHDAQDKPATGWVFPSEKKPEQHWNQGSQKNWHAKALEDSGLEPFPPYTLRHTGLTRIAPYCDVHALAAIAGHKGITLLRKYIHPQQSAIEQAFQRIASATSQKTTPQEKSQTESQTFVTSETEK
jgi:integrase